MPRLFEEVYVYEAPVRVFHWINVACIVSLFTTGLIIGNPPAFLGQQEASFGYWFGTVRFIHFVTAYVFVCNILLRLYWAFRGNTFANWRHYLPLHGRQWRQMGEMVERYALLDVRRWQIVGPNALAAFTYALMLLVVLFEIASGFALYAAASDSWLPALFAWLVPLMGSEYTVRLWHHVLAWIFPIFVIIHVYLVYFNERAQRGGLISTMVSGWRRVESQ